MALMNTFREDNPVNEFKNGLTYVFLATMLVCGSIQLIYLNKALDLFSPVIVCSLYYILFATLTLISTGFLFKEFRFMTWWDILGLVAGFAVSVVSSCIIILFRVSSPSKMRSRSRCKAASIYVGPSVHHQRKCSSSLSLSSLSLFHTHTHTGVRDWSPFRRPRLPSLFSLFGVAIFRRKSPSSAGGGGGLSSKVNIKNIFEVQRQHRRQRRRQG